MDYVVESIKEFFLTDKILPPGGLSLVDPLGQIGTYRTTTSVETPAAERYPAPLRVSARWSDAPEEGHASSTTLTPSFSVLEERHKGIRALCVMVSGHAVGDPAGHEVTQRHHNRHG